MESLPVFLLQQVPSRSDFDQVVSEHGFSEYSWRLVKVHTPALVLTMETHVVSSFSTWVGD